MDVSCQTMTYLLEVCVLLHTISIQSNKIYLFPIAINTTQLANLKKRFKSWQKVWEK